MIGTQAWMVLDNGELPRLEIYDASRPYRFEDSAPAQLRTDLALAADDARFKLLSIDHHGANNLGTQAAELLGSTDVEAGSYRNTLHAQPAATPVVSTLLAKPPARPQTALVVGLPDEIAALDAGDFEDQLSDYDYTPEIHPTEDKGTPGSHQERMLNEDSSEVQS